MAVSKSKDLRHMLEVFRDWGNKKVMKNPRMAISKDRMPRLGVPKVAYELSVHFGLFKITPIARWSNLFFYGGGVGWGSPIGSPMSPKKIPYIGPL